MCSVTETYHRNPFAGEQEVLRKPLPFYYVRDLGTSHVLHCSPPFIPITSFTVVTVVTQYKLWNFKNHK